MVKNQDSVNTFGQIVVFMRVPGKITWFKDKDFTNGLIEGPIEDNGKTILCMDKVFMNGVMEGNMKVNISMIKKKVLGNIGGLMEEFMKDFGKMADNTEKESIFYKMGSSDGVIGKMVEEYGG